MSRKRVRAEPAPETAAEDQMSLFVAESNPMPKRPALPIPHSRVLNRLIQEIARRTGRAYAEINSSLNRKLGVSTRAGASDDLLERGIVMAEEYLAMLDQPSGPPPSAAPAPPVPAQKPRSLKSEGPSPTPEQLLAIEATLADEHFALQAGAGTGKTTTLVMLARARAPLRGMFLAFNRPVVDDASRRFPPHVQCRTGHSLAMRAVGRLYGDRLGQPREPGWKVGERLGISRQTQIRLGHRMLTNRTISYLALQTVLRFCHSADTDIERWHVPRLRGLDDAFRGDLARVVLPYARKAWDDVQAPGGGLVRFEPNHALKIWALTEPRIPVDFLLLDEAQDTNPVMEKVFNAQRHHAQLIMVGDSAQAIYGWRGARDVMTDFAGRQLSLSQSFRFGPDLAAEANRWLAIVEAPIRLRGTPAIDTRIGPLDQADAVLCRTNGGAIGEIFRLLDEGKHVALTGGKKALSELAQAAGNLKDGGRAAHPDLVLFQTWDELVEYATEDPDGQDLLPLVEIIEEHGVPKVLGAMNRLHSEQDAEVTISTAHRSKGREWDTVRIAGDFREPISRERDLEGNTLPGPLDLEDAKLAYVAVTRARKHLDLGGLSWIEGHPDGRPTGLPTPQCVNVQSPSPWDRLGPRPSA
ncbi:UvrD-helicase domain-containing protein [Streptomyces sp. NPDC015492]|uniref:UvrD-helicase domain-containing protein n=1 Tax=Streptomyces sp. NPDC015492 TaxID=3364958 RepID=UPI0037014E24